MREICLPVFIFFLLVAPVFGQSPQARLVDEFGELPCEEVRARLQGLETQIRSEKGNFALIYVYEGKHRVFDSTKEKYALPRFGEAAARIRTMQTRLNFLKFDQKNFIFADGGFREKYWVEFWIVPKGAKLPKASPTLDTIKYRKGKPADICREV